MRLKLGRFKVASELGGWSCINFCCCAQYFFVAFALSSSTFVEVLTVGLDVSLRNFPNGAAKNPPFAGWETSLCRKPTRPEVWHLVHRHRCWLYQPKRDPIGGRRVHRSGFVDTLRIPVSLAQFFFVGRFFFSVVVVVILLLVILFCLLVILCCWSYCDFFPRLAADELKIAKMWTLSCGVKFHRGIFQCTLSSVRSQVVLTGETWPTCSSTSTGFGVAWSGFR